MVNPSHKANAARQVLVRKKRWGVPRAPGNGVACRVGGRGAGHRSTAKPDWTPPQLILWDAIDSQIPVRKSKITVQCTNTTLSDHTFLTSL